MEIGTSMGSKKMAEGSVIVCLKIQDHSIKIRTTATVTTWRWSDLGMNGSVIILDLSSDKDSSGLEHGLQVEFTIGSKTNSKSI